jgi:hypothetical protein
VVEHLIQTRADKELQTKAIQAVLLNIVAVQIMVAEAVVEQDKLVKIALSLHPHKEVMMAEMV